MKIAIWFQTAPPRKSHRKLTGKIYGALLGLALAMLGGTGSLPAQRYHQVAGAPGKEIVPATSVGTERGFLDPAVVPKNITLDQAISTALARNPEILSALQQIRKTRGQIFEVGAQAYPQVGVNATYSIQDDDLDEFGGGGFGGGAPSGGGEEQQQAGQAAAGAGVAQQQGGAATAGQSGSGQGQGQAPATAQQGSGEDSGQGQGQGGGMSGLSGFGGGGNQNWRVAVEVRQLIYSGGRVSSALRAAELANSNTLLELHETINRVVARVVREFYQVILDRELVAVEQENIDVLTRQLEEERVRREAGVVADFNVLRARVELANARPSLIRARNSLQLNKLRLARTMGLDPAPAILRGNVLSPLGELPEPEGLPDLEASLALAYRERPRFRIAMQSIGLREEQVDVAFSGYLPELALSGGYELRKSSLDNDLDQAVNGWFFGVNGTWSIFDGFRTRGRVMQARADLEQAELDFVSTRREIDLSVEETWFQLKTALETVESQKLAVEQGAEALRLARERLDAGTGTQLEVLDTRVAWLRANVIYLTALYDYRTALAEFRRVTGTISDFHFAGAEIVSGEDGIKASVYEALRSESP
jgi:outer membrane protein TolC